MKTVLVGLAAALALTACGEVHCMCIGNPYVPPTPSSGFNAVVTERDTAVTIQVGQKLELVLHARSGMTNWSGVRSSDESILAPIVNPAATAVRGVTLAAFQALAPGQVRVTATAGAACSPGQACPMYAVAYTLTVTVT